MQLTQNQLEIIEECIPNDNRVLESIAKRVETLTDVDLTHLYIVSKECYSINQPIISDSDYDLIKWLVDSKGGIDYLIAYTNKETVIVSGIRYMAQISGKICAVISYNSVNGLHSKAKVVISDISKLLGLRIGSLATITGLEKYQVLYTNDNTAVGNLIASNCPSCGKMLSHAPTHLQCTNVINCPAQKAHTIHRMYKSIGFSDTNFVFIYDTTIVWSQYDLVSFLYSGLTENDIAKSTDIQTYGVVNQINTIKSNGVTDSQFVNGMVLLDLSREIIKDLYTTLGIDGLLNASTETLITHLKLEYEICSIIAKLLAEYNVVYARFKNNGLIK